MDTVECIARERAGIHESTGTIIKTSPETAELEMILAAMPTNTRTINITMTIKDMFWLVNNCDKDCFVDNLWFNVY